MGRFSATADSGLALPKDRCCSRDLISMTARCVEHPYFCLLFLLLRCSSSTVTTMIIVPETPSIVARWRGAGLTRPSLRLIQWSYIDRTVRGELVGSGFETGTIVAPRFYLACVGWTSFSSSRLLESCNRGGDGQGKKRSFSSVRRRRDKYSMRQEK